MRTTKQTIIRVEPGDNIKLELPEGLEIVINMDSPLDDPITISCPRAGWWFGVDNEKGNARLHKGNTRMDPFNYDPNGHRLEASSDEADYLTLTQDNRPF